ncbi:N-acetylmuramoyl-L-alanine amidase [Anaerovibrio sp. JC8]|uniref:glucosaminidase domain-containing protein n=1 Tax=Anaerovibrio sp. JC8 TaxID=1240085 RepID=UPI000A0D00C7|nr:glucosaminidase domain-containing protein [Anaerovibrio sp. JC8]ORT99620.1 N-acetylmuramoyl-L-alanine amidase [Anaerovibrio sp. JC8]
MLFNKKSLRFLCAIGAVAVISCGQTTEAKQTVGQTTVSEERTYNTGKTTVATDNATWAERRKSFAERIEAILHPEPEKEPEVVVPTDSNEMNIMGAAVATQEQCVRYLLKNNPNPLLNTTPEELVNFYYEEASREGIRPDIAFAQALKETGFFSYGGTVIPAQNNYCGLGTTSATVKGAFFDSPRVGVRAHIQHLLAYASTKDPETPVVDPRYSLVRGVYGDNTLEQWQDLNGRWAVPGVGYGQSILDYYHAILNS